MAEDLPPPPPPSASSTASLSANAGGGGGVEFPPPQLPPWATWRTVVRERTIDNHPFLNQSDHMPDPVKHHEKYCFVVGADTQLGINSQNEEWQTELDNCTKAIEYIHQMSEKRI